MVPGFFILCDRQDHKENDYDPNQQNSCCKPVQPARTSQRTQDSHAELEQTGKRYSQKEKLDDPHQVDGNRSEILCLDGDEQISPLIESMGNPEGGQPAQTARQIETR